MKSYRVYKGFTLLELLLTMLILTTLGGLIVGIFVVSLRSSTKVNNLHSIRQNGNYVLLQMERMLRFSAQFGGVSSDGQSFITACQSPPTSTSSLTAYQFVRFTAFDGGETTFSCSGSPQTIASNSASLIDTTAYTVSNCSFTCFQVTPEAPPTVGFYFTINKRNATNFLDDPAPITFQTSVTMRNFNN